MNDKILITNPLVKSFIKSIFIIAKIRYKTKELPKYRILCIGDILFALFEIIKLIKILNKNAPINDKIFCLGSSVKNPIIKQ